MMTPISKPYTGRSITKDQKWSFALINIGTVLDYFDFSVSIHIALLINNCFFPKSDAYTKSLLLALSFSMNYILRPIGAVVFGYLGDLWGRKSTIIITTMIMSITSLCIGCLPTYDHIGYAASIIILVCRAIQGMASSAEVIGAKVYTTELFKAPDCYFYSSLVRVACDAGALLAISICVIFLYLDPENGWRYVFFFGSGIAIIGCISRTILTESPEFLDAIKYVNVEKRQHIIQTLSNKWHNVLAYFAVGIRTPIIYFVTFVYMGEYLTQNFGYTPKDIIYHNLSIIFVSGIIYIGVAILARQIFPLHILKFSAIALLIYFFFFPYLISQAHSVEEIFILQIIIWALNLNGLGVPIFVRGFPVIGRYTIVGITYSFSRAIAAVVTSYLCVWLAAKFGFAGVTLLMIMGVGTSLIGLYKFIPCEEDRWMEANWSQRYSLCKHPKTP